MNSQNCYHCDKILQSKFISKYPCGCCLQLCNVCYLVNCEHGNRVSHYFQSKLYKPDKIHNIGNCEEIQQRYILSWKRICCGSCNKPNCVFLVTKCCGMVIPTCQSSEHKCDSIPEQSKSHKIIAEQLHGDPLKK